MAYLNENLAYDFDRFTSAAPQRRPASQQPPKPRLVKAKPKTARQLRAERLASRQKVVKLLAVAAVCVSFIGPNIYSRVQINELNSTVMELDKQLSEKRSENARLTMELTAKISPENVKDYAENVLGMVKRERYQIIYFDLESGNEIVPAQ